jgi:hypothetical protein
MRFGLIINGLAATDGGFFLRLMPLLVIGLGHDHSLMLTSMRGSLGFALVPAIIIQLGQAQRGSLGQCTKALLPRAPWHQ